MKKIFSSMLAMMAAFFFAFNVSAEEEYTFTLNIDNPDAVAVTVAYEPVDIVAGDNTFTVPAWTAVIVNSVEPYAFKSITNVTLGEDLHWYDTTWYFYPDATNVGVIKIETYNLEEARTASCIVNVDNASKVVLTRQGTNTKVQLEDGENIVKYDPVKEDKFLFYSSDWGIPLYKVTMDGVNIPGDDMDYFYVYPTDGCVIDVEANFPDIDLNFTLNVTEGCEDLIAYVCLNEEKVPDFKTGTMSVKAGTMISIIPNSDLYKVVSAEINGEPWDWSGRWAHEFVITQDTEISIEAAPYATYPVTVIINDPAGIKLYKGYAYYNNVVELQAGENTVQVSEASGYLDWEKNPGYVINSVYLNEESLSTRYGGSYVNEGDVLTFDITQLELNNEAVLWIDDTAACNWYFAFTTVDADYFNIYDGYNYFRFADSMNPFNLYLSGELITVNKVFNNGEVVEPMYSSGTAYEIELADKDVLKIFLTTEPVDCQATVTLVDNPDVTVMRDIILPVTEFGTPITVFNETQFTIAPENGCKVDVTVNGEAVEANEEGKYDVIVKDTTTSIDVKNLGTGVNMLGVDSVKDNSVYNMLGVRLGNADAISTLPAGCYIVNGRKVVVK